MNETFPPRGRLTPLSLPENREFFLRCYAETWRIAHGDLRGFREEYIYDMYLRRWEREPESLLGLWLGEELTALLALDSSRGEKLLWISFLHVAELHRREGLSTALLEAAARKRGFLLARGELNTERMAHVLLEEYRSCKLGRFTFEGPEIYEQEQKDGTGSVED